MNNYSNFDVLFGKGPLAVSHPGNIYYRAFVNDHFHDFCNATRFEKFDILTKVYDEVHNNGSFLKKNPTTNKWEEADFEEVMKKIRASFCTLQRKQKKTIEAASTMVVISQSTGNSTGHDSADTLDDEVLFNDVDNDSDDNSDDDDIEKLLRSDYIHSSAPVDSTRFTRPLYFDSKVKNPRS